MPETYRLSLVNSVLFGLVFSLYLAVRHYRRHQSFPWFLFLIVFGLLPVWSIFRYGTYESSDLSINVVKTIAFYQNLTAGILIPRWAGDLNATYGYPNFIFAYPLPYYLASVWHFLGFSFLNSVKGVMALSFLGSGLTMYAFLRHHFNASAAFLGAIAYLFTPYHLVDLHFRVDIGELTALAVLPLVFLGLTRILRSQKLIWVYLTALFLALIILSHQVVALVTFPLAGLYFLFIYRHACLHAWLKLLASSVLGLGLSAFYWLPALGEARFTLQAVYGHEVESVSLTRLLFAPWRFGFLFQGPHGELAFLLGYIQWFIFVSAFILMVRRLPTRRLVTFALLCLSVCLIAMLPISRSLWAYVPLLNKMQFATRLLTVCLFLVSILAAAVAAQWRPRTFDLALAIIMASTILNWGNRRMIPETTDTYFTAGLPASTARGEGLTPAAPRWVDPAHPWQNQLPPVHLEAISGDLTILNDTRSVTRHTYELYAAQAIMVRENTLYFPGWQLTDNGQILSLNPATFANGIIRFPLTPGLHYLTLEFTETPVRRVGDLTSLVAWLLVSWGLFKNIGHWPFFLNPAAKS